MNQPPGPLPDAPNRRAPRHRTLRTGIITYQDFAISFRCTIRDRSAGGARLKLPAGLTPPRDFWLIEVSEGVAHRAHAVWRRGEEVGAELSDPLNLRQVGRDPIRDELWQRQLHALWIAAAGS